MPSISQGLCPLTSTSSSHSAVSATPVLSRSSCPPEHEKSPFGQCGGEAVYRVSLRPGGGREKRRAVPYVRRRPADAWNGFARLSGVYNGFPIGHGQLALPLWDPVSTRGCTLRHCPSEHCLVFVLPVPPSGPVPAASGTACRPHAHSDPVVAMLPTHRSPAPSPAALAAAVKWIRLEDNAGSTLCPYARHFSAVCRLYLQS